MTDSSQLDKRQSHKFNGATAGQLMESVLTLVPYDIRGAARVDLQTAIQLAILDDQEALPLDLEHEPADLAEAVEMLRRAKRALESAKAPSSLARGDSDVAEEIWRQFRDSRENMEGEEVDLFVRAVAPYLAPAATATTDSPARVGLPLLYNLVSMWAQPKDEEWFKDMAELMRLADKLLYEQGYEVSPYVTNEYQIAADSANVRSASGHNEIAAPQRAVPAERPMPEHATAAAASSTPPATAKKEPKEIIDPPRGWTP